MSSHADSVNPVTSVHNFEIVESLYSCVRHTRIKYTTTPARMLAKKKSRSVPRSLHVESEPKDFPKKYSELMTVGGLLGTPRCQFPKESVDADVACVSERTRQVVCIVQRIQETP